MGAIQVNARLSVPSGQDHLIIFNIKDDYALKNKIRTVRHEVSGFKGSTLDISTPTRTTFTVGGVPGVM